ncbi:MAG: hypothetical protein COA44_00930 [Arcobacter sp.]|nr:MAG: hypothetical protein COA44_00930 [Arcobacter sp.]
MSKKLAVLKSKYEENSVYSFYIFCLPLFVFFIFFNYIHGSSLQVYIDILVVLIISLSFYLFKFPGQRVLSKSLILSSLLLLYMSILLFGSFLNVSFYLFFIFPLISIFLFGKKQGLVWIYVLCGSILVFIGLDTLNLYPLSYDFRILYALGLALLLETFIFIYFFSITIEYKNALEKYNCKLINTDVLVNKYLMVIHRDMAGKIYDVNTNFLDFSQYARDELIGMNFDSVCVYDNTALDAEVEEDILKCKKKDGSFFYVQEYSEFEYDENLQKLGHLIFMQDVSQSMALEKASLTDTLTGLYNRMYFDKISKHRLSAFDRYEDVSSLILCDIDDFKAINDKYGHLQGDKVLQEISAIVSAVIRESDTLARWGGEEFAILLPNTNLDKAVVTAQKICDTIYKNDFALNEEITSSFGVSVTRKNDNQMTWFLRADKALYQAKDSGKNKVCFF